MEISWEIKQRIYIQLRTALNISAVAIQKELQLIQRNKAYSYSVVSFWSNRFHGGRESVEDDPGPGRAVTAATKYNIQRIEQLVEEDRRISLRAIQALTSMNLKTIHDIMHDHLDMRKRKSRWVPHFLTPENRQKRLNFAKTMLTAYQAGRLRLDHIITGDECWIYDRKI